MKRAILFGILTFSFALAGVMAVFAWTGNNNGYPSQASIPANDIKPSPIRACVNMGGALEAPNEGDWGYTIRGRDFQTIANAGFDTVRIPIKWSAHTSQTAPYEIDRQFLRRIDQVTEQALNSGLQVILNVHHYDEVSEDARLHLPRLEAIWEQLIARYAGSSDRVMFEFLNEPHSDMTFKRVDETNRRLLAKVRAVDPDRWVILGGGQWGTLDGLLGTDPPYDAYAMVTFHFYDPFEFTHQGAPWAHKQVPLGQIWGSNADRQSIARSFGQAARYRDQVGMPMLLGEFGVYHEVPDAERAQWTRYVRQTAERVGFGWCYWDWSTSLGMYDTDIERFDPGMLEALMAG